MDDNNEHNWSSNETEALRELKAEIEKEFGPNAADDDKIKRFLIARNFDVFQANLMLKNHLIWRKQYNVDTMLQNSKRSEVFAKYFPVTTVGVDKEGHLLIIVNFGGGDPKGFYKTFTKAEIMRNLAYYLEMYEQQLRDLSKATGKHIDKWTVVADLEGFSFHKFSNKTSLEMAIALCRLYDGNYPERLNVVYAVNSSTAIQLLFSIVKPFISLKTQEKILFYGRNGWKNPLLELIEPNVLPAYLGGQRTDPDGNPRCCTIVNHGGDIPKKLYMKNNEENSLKHEKGVKMQVLKRRGKINLPLNVEEVGSLIEWDIEIAHYDIAFGLYLKDCMEQLPLIPLHKLDTTFGSRETGAHKCLRPGVYDLIFDNSYSVFRSKTIYYKVSVVKPDDIKFSMPNDLL